VSTIRSLLIAAGLLSFSAAAIAAPVVAHLPVPASITQMMKKLTGGHITPLYLAAGPEKNIQALVVKSSMGQKSIAWLFDGKYLAPGMLLTANGQNLTATMAQKLHIMPKPVAPAKLAKSMLAAPGFVWGHAGPMITAFLDPNCIFCHLFYEHIAPLVKEGKVRVKVVPVGFLKPSSFPKAVTIMQSKNPSDSWAYDEKHFNVQEEEGGIKPSAYLDQKVVKEIHANTKLLASTGEVATPTIVFCSGDKTNDIQMIRGLPRGPITNLTKQIKGSLDATGCAAS